MSANVSHVLGRAYLCPKGHTTDDVEIGTTNISAFIDEPIDAKPCAECGEVAKLKFYGSQHPKTETCEHCPQPTA